MSTDAKEQARRLRAEAEIGRAYMEQRRLIALAGDPEQTSGLDARMGYQREFCDVMRAVRHAADAELARRAG